MTLSSLGALVALALVAGGYYWWGGPRERRAAQQVLDEACDGVLPSREMRDVLGDGPYASGPGRLDLRSTERGADGHGVRTVTCDVSGDGVRVAGRGTNEAEVEVTVQSVPRRDGDVTGDDRREEVGPAEDPLYPRLSPELPPVGLGGGWRGLFTTGESLTDRPGTDAGAHAATVVTLLDCAGDRGGLLVTVHAKDDDVTLDDPERRTAFARVATATATKAAQKWGCDAELGASPRSVALPVNVDESVPLAEASGTCRGVPGRARQISRAWESRSAAAPVEVCVVAGERPELPGPGAPFGVRGYHLVASYGPYAETERRAYAQRYGRYSEKPGPGEAPAGRLEDGGRWASAVCRDGSGPALFTVRDDAAWNRDRSPSYEERRPQPSAADLAYERAALAEFARRSARNHGCEKPRLP
ncbi:hypothetical protein ABZS76_06825 [Streptomyces sp. NPDC005562]|uniref:hypothetical protein n=1 Tax=Streptomyces sp. NPDC005562 TaxID=3154890 RepID=UPI0033ADCB12